MARPREFDLGTALDEAIGVFREQGFAASSAADLSRAMGIGRQSLYGAFGDKWGLYLAAVKRDVTQDTEDHLLALSTGPRAIDGLEILLARVRAKAAQACLGLCAVCEFGRSRAELTAILAAAERRFLAVLAARLREAQQEGSAGPEIDVKEAAAFLAATINAVRVAARSGAGAAQLQALAELALRALR
ncbi:MAG: TetR/AcrR family transcriptional regulator [Hyphomonas sp.]|uniref:TetR/AcrR family transcriptional regulator n=1 Tax=Hyphomonas sp. TaxID=87 RepID=UPI0034A09AD3